MLYQRNSILDVNQSFSTQPSLAISSARMIQVLLTECPLPDGCMTVPNFMHCLSLEKEGCENLILVDLNGNAPCPYPRVQCGQNFAGIGQPRLKCPVISQDPAACMDEERIEDCLEMKSECRNLNITNECPFDFTCLEEETGGNSTNCPAVNPECFDEGLQRSCIAMESNCRKFQIPDGCPVEFSCLDDDGSGPLEPPASRTWNHLFVLNINATNSTRLDIVGNVTLGDKNKGTL